MGCITQKSPKKLFTKDDLLELQKHFEELHEKRVKILKWMEGGIECSTKIPNRTKLKWKNTEGTEQPLYWQEAWGREQQLVQHPSLIDSRNSKLSCITLIDENLRLPSEKEIELFWSEFHTNNTL